MEQYPFFYEDAEGRPLTGTIELSGPPKNWEEAEKLAKQSFPSLLRMTGYGVQPYQEGDELISSLSSLLS